VVAIFAGACRSTLSSHSCTRGLCPGGVQSAEVVGAGESCLVVDEGPGGGGLGAQVAVNVVRGGGPGVPLPVTGSSFGAGDTCVEMDLVRSEGCPLQSIGPEVRSYFTLCPGEVRTVSATLASCTPKGGTYHVYGVEGALDGTKLGCAAVPCGGASASVMSFDGAGLNWVVLDGQSVSDCGNLAATVTYR
jgi:hypothetical protein